MALASQRRVLGKLISKINLIIVSWLHRHQSLHHTCNASVCWRQFGAFCDPFLPIRCFKTGFIHVAALNICIASS